MSGSRGLGFLVRGSCVHVSGRWVEYSWSGEIISRLESLGCERRKFYHDPVVLFQYRVLIGHVWVSGFRVFISWVLCQC